MTQLPWKLCSFGTGSVPEKSLNLQVKQNHCHVQQKVFAGVQKLKEYLKVTG